MTNEMLNSTIPVSPSTENVPSAIKLFADKGFKIRVIMRCSDPWFVAKDVATCIEHKDVSTMCKLCRDKDKVVESASNFDSADLAESGNARITLISESGLYRILAKCNLPKCEPFESWVFDEVLPSIRKTGGYGIRTVDDMINDPDTAIRLLTQLKIMRLQNKQLEMELDEAIRTKAQIGSNREATAMNTASQKSKECKRLTAENDRLKEENVTLKDGWWSVSDVARMIARVCKLPRVYANDTLISKCRIGLRYFAAKRNRMTRMLEVDGMHQDKYGNLVQNTAEHFDDDTVADFRQWVDENPEMFPKIKSVLVITMDDEKSENA